MSAYAALDDRIATLTAMRAAAQAFQRAFDFTEVEVRKQWDEFAVDVVAHTPAGPLFVSVDCDRIRVVDDKGATLFRREGLDDGVVAAALAQMAKHTGEVKR